MANTTSVFEPAAATHESGRPRCRRGSCRTHREGCGSPRFCGSVSAAAGEVLGSEIWLLRADLEGRRERYSLSTDQVSITSPQSEREAEKMHDLCRQVCRLFVCDEGFKPDFLSLLPDFRNANISRFKGIKQ